MNECQIRDFCDALGQQLRRCRWGKNRQCPRFRIKNNNNNFLCVVVLEEEKKNDDEYEIIILYVVVGSSSSSSSSSAYYYINYILNIRRIDNIFYNII